MRRGRENPKGYDRRAGVRTRRGRGASAAFQSFNDYASFPISPPSLVRAVNTPMERNKALMIAVLTITAGAAAFFVAGSAFGQDWYEYKGRLTAGNAYLVTVPANAEALELELIGNGDGAAATVAVFDPADEKLAVWKLDGATGKATLANPDAGDHVLFVYTLTNGGLSLRTLAAETDAGVLSIKRIGTERDDVRITSVDKPSALSETFTAKLKKEPVFATLLYSGSAENLAATVASPKGTVLEVVSETGTAYSPGLYGTVTGERNVFPENLASGVYTVTASADRFEGDLFLTFANFRRSDVKEIAPDPTLPEPVEPTNAAEIWPEVPTALEIGSGVSSIVFSLPTEKEEEADDDGDNNSFAPPAPPGPGGDWGWTYHGGCPEAISVYTPDDKLLGIATFDEETMTATMPIPAPGEYVVVVRGMYSHTPVLASLDGVLAPQTRELATTVEEIDLGKIMPLEGGVTTEFTLEKAPLLLAWRMQGGSGAVFADGVFESPLGEAVRQNSVVAGDWTMWSEGMTITYENLVDGEYAFTLNTPLAYGSIVGWVVHYDREHELESEEEA